MYKPFALSSVVFLLFTNVSGLNFKLWGRQDNSASDSPSSLNPTSSNSTFNATAAIISALNQNGIPSSCDPECIPSYNTTMTCQDVACRCTDEYEKSLFDCYLCAGNALHAKFDTVQGVIDSLEKDCFQIGFNLTKLTFPGENPNRTVISTFSSVSFTLTVPTAPASTNTQNVGMQAQPTQGTSGNGPSPDEAGQGATPPPAPTNGGSKEMTTGIVVPIALVLLGFL